MSFKFKTSTLLVLLAVVSRSVFGQIAVTSTSTATALATALTGGGVTISSPTLNCNSLANGTFTVTPGTLVGAGASATVWGINSGIVLSTGKVSSVPGAYSATVSSTNFGGAGDPDLTTLAGAATHDACILEFDIIPTGDTIKFDYIFGSEEYRNSTCGTYNDAFAFFISGPGITGLANMALVPGTTIPVTVNSVNNGVPGTGAGTTLANCTVMGPGSPFTAYYNDNTGGANFKIKGFTNVFTAAHDVIPCNTYHLKITIADAGNFLYDSDVFIKQGSIVSAVYANTAAVCQGANTTVTATPSGGSWSSANTAIATVDALTGDVHGVSAGTVDLTYTTGAGCFKVTSLTVNPTPVLTSASSVCTGLSLSLAANPAGGTWAGGTPGIATISSAGVANGIAVGTVPLTYTSPAGCVLATTFSVYSLPPISGVFNVCEGSYTTLTHPTSGGTWTSATTSVATVTSAGIVGGASAGTSDITYSMGGTCYSIAPVTVNPRPAVPTVNAVHYCQDVAATVLTATGTGIRWYPTATGGVGSTVAPTPSTATAGITNYYVTQTVGGCESPRVILQVTINPKVEFSIVGDTFSCPHDTLAFTFVGSVPPTVQYSWTIPAGTSLLPGSNLNGPAITIINDTNVNSTITLHAEDVVTGCAGDDVATVYINTMPSVQPYTQENPCLGDTVNLGLSSHSSDSYVYTWWVDGVLMGNSSALNVVTHSSNSGGPYTVSWNTTGVHVISVQSMANGGHCPSKVTYDTVKVHELPDATITFKSFRAVPCFEDSVYFAARVYNTAYAYMWTPTHSFHNRTGHEAWATLDQKEMDVVLTVSDPFGCTARSSVHFSTDGCCTISMPTAFTPNHDGKNDVFRPIFPDQGRTVTGGGVNDTLDSYHRFSVFRIQNRWGQTVFETTNNYPAWDGTYAGVPQDMGVYYYVIIFDCDNKKVTQTGDVTLIR